jgi:uncharacterized protein (DUF1800 family)
MNLLKTPRVRLLPAALCVFGLAMVLALPFTAQQQRPISPIPPLKPLLPDGVLSSGEKLIRLPPGYSLLNNRSRRAADSLPPLTEEQKILHLLNRAGFGPRPGDIERVRKIGIERYIEEQLHPQDITDDFLSHPLLAFNTLQMSIPETVQYFAPAPVRSTPTPAPTPTPTPTPTKIEAGKPLLTSASKDETDSEMNKAEMAKGEMAAQPNQAEKMPASTSMAQQPQLQPGSQQMTAPTPTPKPVSRRDPQQPLRELQQAKLLRAIYSEKQLQEVMVDFWFNHFNVFAGKDAARWMVTSFERDAIRPHALGNFKEMLVAVAQSPAMLYYLDNFLSQAEVRPREQGSGRAGERESGRTEERKNGSQDSQSPDLPLSRSPAPPLSQSPPVRRPGLNENYARELMELHTLGVDGGYTQEDVIEVARCFTGWTVTPQPNAAFVFRPRIHDRGEKRVLGARIPSGGGIEDGLRVLELLAKHPSTARFVSRKLCQRFIADEPPQSIVDRAAEVFKVTDGDLRAVVRAILTSPEFYSPKHYRNKVKSPLELSASAIRATGASTDAATPLIQWVARMGEPLYLCQPPTGYSEESSRWMSNATLLERMNFSIALISNRINGTRVDVSRFVSTDVLRKEERLLDQLTALLVHSDISDETRDNLAGVIKESRHKLVPAKNDERTARRNGEQLISGVAALILGSREFQVK